MSANVLEQNVHVSDPPPLQIDAPPAGDVDAQVLEALSEFSGGAMCIGSSTGDIHGLNERLAAVREQSGISMCFWGAFGK